MKTCRLPEKTAVILPDSSPRRVGLLAGICWTKSQSPRYSAGVGAVPANHWCITINLMICQLLILFVCLFVLRRNVPVNSFSVMSGRNQRFLGLTSTVGS